MADALYLMFMQYAAVFTALRNVQAYNIIFIRGNTD